MAPPTPRFGESIRTSAKVGLKIFELKYLFCRFERDFQPAILVASLF